MNDTLPTMAEFEIAHSILRGALFECYPQWRAHRKGLSGAAWCAGNNVVGCSEGQFGIAKCEPAFRQLVERRSTGQVVQQMTVDMQECPTIAQVADDVRIPDLIEQRQSQDRLLRCCSIGYGGSRLEFCPQRVPFGRTHAPKCGSDLSIHGDCRWLTRDLERPQRLISCADQSHDQ